VADTESDPEILGIVRTAIRVERLIENVTEPGSGAVAAFVGVVRNRPGQGVPARDGGRRVARLEYEAYENMALLHFREIAEELRERFEVGRLAIVHRVGTLEVGETSVAVVVSAPHREDAFAACRHAIERLKAEAPIWKKEIYEDGATGWVANAVVKD
jgi:molybdopterin synthase catalytic subunit